MIPMDHLDGFFDYDTDIGKTDDGLYYARALGYEAKHRFQDQALNDLNEQIYNAISRGELVPNQN